MDIVEYLKEHNPEGFGWRAPQVCRLAGCSYRQLDYWCRTGLIEEDLQVARGSGSQRLFSNEMVILIWIIVQLQRMGVSLNWIRRAGIIEAVISFAGRLSELEEVLITSGLIDAAEGSDQEEVIERSRLLVDGQGSNLDPSSFLLARASA